MSDEHEDELAYARRDFAYALISLIAMATGWGLGKLIGFPPAIGVIVAALTVEVPLEYRMRQRRATMDSRLVV